MTKSEETTILLEALDQGFVRPDVIIRWADELIAATPKPPGWLIDLSTLPKAHKEDVAAFLREHAQPLPVRRKIELIAFAWDRRLLTLRETLPLLFRVTILDNEAAPADPSEDQLRQALVDWDFQENPDIIEPEVEATLTGILSQYLESADAISRLVTLGPEQGGFT